MTDVSSTTNATAGTHATPAPSTDFQPLLLAALPSMRQQAMALTRNRADAEDLLQATVVNALAGRESFIPGTNLRAWLSSIMRNRFLSDIRRRRETTSVDDIPEASLSFAPAQEDNLALGELRRHLARLPADHRLVLMMISVQGMSYEEASAELGVAVGTLKCRVFRARKLLKAWLLGEDELPRSAASHEKQREERAGTRWEPRVDRTNRCTGANLC